MSCGRAPAGTPTGTGPAGAQQPPAPDSSPSKRPAPPHTPVSGSAIVLTVARTAGLLEEPGRGSSARRCINDHGNEVGERGVLTGPIGRRVPVRSQERLADIVGRVVGDAIPHHGAVHAGDVPKALVGDREKPQRAHRVRRDNT